MKRKKLLLYLLSACCIAVGGIALGSCNKGGFSKGKMSFTLLSDGTYEVSQGSTTGNKSVTIPSTYNGKPVTRIAKQGFMDCAMTSLTIPQSIIKIGEGAFADCESLKTVSLANGVTQIDTHAFAGCESLKSFTIPDSVTEIAPSMFSNCEQLETVDIPTSVTSIGDQAFYGCLKLENFIIPQQIERMGSNVFNASSYYKNENLFNEHERLVYVGKLDNPYYYLVGRIDGVTSVNIHKDCKIIGGEKFLSVVSIEVKPLTQPIDLVIPDGITTIAPKAFQHCDLLKSVSIPQSVTDFGNSAFSQCNNLTKAVVDAKTIGESAFSYCPALNNVSFGENVTMLGSAAFAHCTSLTDVILTENVQQIHSEAFSDCTALKGLTIPKSISLIDSNAFDNCQQLQIVAYTGDIGDWCNIRFGDDEANPLCFTNNFFINNMPATDLVIPAGISQINDYAFYGYKALRNISLPNGLTSIGTQAFDGCNALQTVRVPDSITSVGTGAFASCPSLRFNAKDELKYLGNEVNQCVYLFGTVSKEIAVANIDTACKIIGENAFDRCLALTTVTIPDSVVEIGNSAFNACAQLTKVRLPQNIRNLGIAAFSGCSALQYTDVNGVMYLGNSANPYLYLAKATENLTSVTVNNGCKYIGASAFAGNESLTSVTIPNSVVEIQESAFSGTGLTHLTIPASVKTVGKRAFASCKSLSYLTIENGVQALGEEAFRDCENLTAIKIPGSVETIPYYCFYLCKNVHTIILEEGVRYIAEKAFTNCLNVKKLVFPKSITFVGPYSLRFNALEVLYYGGTTQSWDPAVLANQFINTPRYYYSQTQPTEKGLFWRYENGVPTPW